MVGRMQLVSYLAFTFKINCGSLDVESGLVFGPFILDSLTRVAPLESHWIPAFLEDSNLAFNFLDVYAAEE